MEIQHEQEGQLTKNFKQNLSLFWRFRLSELHLTYKSVLSLTKIYPEFYLIIVNERALHRQVRSVAAYLTASKN
jgi:hypothetical protein